ncbi:DUF2726 domain-containing protein [Algicola sagamiensis]|uniref:DUF2726 domain-containing protein n=1 Tax=Algicola sagamiensis TaxID=163869 RepID=UPI00037E4D2B|nr:DUF2726 domain-containing protein [Algicola sagamiensis]
MEFVIFLLTVLCVLIAVIVSRFMDNGNPYPFTKRSNMYTGIERSFLTMLERAMGKDYKVMSRVRLTDLIEIKDGTSSRAKRAAMLKANTKYIDFVLCDKNSMDIVAAVDLVNNNDKSGHKAGQDWFVTGALESAGLPHIRIKVRPGYKVDEIRQCIQFKIGKTGSMKAKPRIIKPKPSTPVLSENQMKAQSTALAQT